MVKTLFHTKDVMKTQILQMFSFNFTFPTAHVK